MEYIKINESRLKIMLEREDLLDWDISIDELDYANPAAKSVFEGLLACAKDDLGFDTSGHKVLLQLYPSRDGGCELFITRLGEIEEESNLAHSKEENKSLCHAAYSFERLSHLIAVCKRLRESDFDGQSSAYFEQNGKWFLTLCFEERSPSHSLDRFAFISEYGECENPKALSLYLCEYADTIREGDAISALSVI